MTKQCERPNCTTPLYARGMCKHHYMKWRRVGRIAPVHADYIAAAEHARALVAAGMSRAEIARRANMGVAVVARLLRGEQRYVYADTLTSILAVEIPAPEERGARTPVQAIGAQRRLQALSMLGWPPMALAKQIGCTHTAIHTIRAGKYERCEAHLWVAIRDTYDKLWTTPGPSVRQAKFADTNGWALPMEWDDIDDPDEVPSGRRTQVGQRDQALDRIEIVEEWLDDPRPEWAKGTTELLAERLGVRKRTIERDKARIQKARTKQEDAA